MEENEKKAEEARDADAVKEEKKGAKEPHSEKTENLVALVVFGVLILIGIGIFTKGFGLLDNNASTKDRVIVPLGSNPVTGSPNATILIVAFSDYECPFCRKGEEAIQGILTRYNGSVMYIFRNFPLTRIHPYAYNAALAAQCANEQKAYWEYHEYLFSHQDKLALQDLKDAAKLFGLDEQRFNECLDTQRYKGVIQEDIAAATQLGITGTPTFFINGIRVVGAQPEELAKIIEEELKR